MVATAVEKDEANGDGSESDEKAQKQDAGAKDDSDEREDAEQAEREEAERERRSDAELNNCLLYTSPSPRDKRQSRMPSSA